MDQERRIYAEKEARYIEIVKAASPALPSENNWVSNPKELEDIKRSLQEISEAKGIEVNPAEL